jgi:hypothetical protein
LRLARVRFVVVLMCSKMRVIDFCKGCRTLYRRQLRHTTDVFEIHRSKPESHLFPHHVRAPQTRTGAFDIMLTNLTAYTGVHQHWHDSKKHAETPSANVFDESYGMPRRTSCSSLDHIRRNIAGDIESSICKSPSACQSQSMVIEQVSLRGSNVSGNYGLNQYCEAVTTSGLAAAARLSGPPLGFRHGKTRPLDS